MAMKLSCLPVSFYPQMIGGGMSILDWAQIALDVGLDAIDLSIILIKDQSPAYLEETRKALGNLDIGVTMVTTYSDFTHPDPEERARQVAKSGQDIAVAAQLGAELVRVTAGQARPGTGRNDGVAWAVQGLTDILEFAKDHGLTLVFENHYKAPIWQYADFSFPTDIFLEIVERTSGIGLGVNWDTANTLAYGDDPVPVLAKVLNRVVSVHAAETAQRGDLKPVLVGTGLVSFREMFSMLKGAGFDGWLCIEEASQQGQAGIEAAAQFVRETWEMA
jgi:sugar phosphate isomerase/epimerase